MRYIELNPLRAGMVKELEEYPWSSYHHNALGKIDSLIQSHFEYCNLGTTAEEQQKNYQSLFEIPLELELVREVREATNKYWPLGSREFKQSLAQSLARRVEPSGKGGDRKSQNYIEKLKINRV